MNVFIQKHLKIKTVKIVSFSLVLTDLQVVLVHKGTISGEIEMSNCKNKLDSVLPEV